MDDNKELNGYTKLYHPAGAQVALPVPLYALTPENAAAMFANVNRYVQAGFLVNAPGLDEGESVETISHIVRRSKVNKDSTETPVIDLYPVRANFRVLGIYLNQPEQVKEFEQACGVSLKSLPLYEAEGTIERGKKPALDKFVIPLPAPVKVVYTKNPRWEGEDDKKNPKRVFVRWQPSAEGKRRDLRAEWEAFVKTNSVQEIHIRQALGTLKVSEWLAAESEKPRTIEDAMAQVLGTMKPEPEEHF